MEKILKKTERERAVETSLLPLSVESTRNFYWACEKCSTAFFKGDVIAKSSGGGYYCLNKIKTFFGEKVCMGRVYGGDEESFHKFYKFETIK